MGAQPRQSACGPCSHAHLPALCLGVIKSMLWFCLSSIPFFPSGCPWLTPSTWFAFSHDPAPTLGHCSVNVPLTHQFMTFSLGFLNLKLVRSQGLFLSNNCKIQELLAAPSATTRRKHSTTRERKEARSSEKWEGETKGPETLSLWFVIFPKATTFLCEIHDLCNISPFV